MSAMPNTTPDAARRIEELGRIIMAYSEVTDRLQQSHERLEKTVAALSEELGEKNRLLERKNRLAALGEMAAGMAHEIRNPLGGIQLYASMLASDVADRPEPLQLVRKISAGVKRLEALVSQVLQFTREMRVELVDADLCAVIAQSVEYAAEALNARHIACDVVAPPALMARIDPLLLGQAILNLLLNAAEAVETNGQIQITCEKADDASDARQARLIVSDNGPGIAADVMDKIFNPFFTTKQTGTGLGLAIVHRIVEAHDGTIIVKNQSPRGARFEIRI